MDSTCVTGKISQLSPHSPDFKILWSPLFFPLTFKHPYNIEFNIDFPMTSDLFLELISIVKHLLFS